MGVGEELDFWWKVAVHLYVTLPDAAKLLCPARPASKHWVFQKVQEPPTHIRDYQDEPIGACEELHILRKIAVHVCVVLPDAAK